MGKVNISEYMQVRLIRPFDHYDGDKYISKGVVYNKPSGYY